MKHGMTFIAILLLLSIGYILGVTKRIRDYQIDLNKYNIQVYDGDKLIGTVPYGHSPLDSLLMSDNQ